MATHNHYQPQGVTVHTRQIGRKNWAWRVCDFFYCEIDHGSGCKTKAEAHGIAMDAKRAYLANLVVTRITVTLDKPPKKRKKR